MSKLAISVSTWDYDRVRAIMDGRVAIEGCDVNYVPLAPEECFHRLHYHQEFDVSEIGFSHYLNDVSRDAAQYVAVPVFLSRVFRHSAIYVRTDRGIAAPADLKGRRVGVPEFQMTAAIWTRGMLKDVFGVDYADIDWVEGGLEEYGRKSKVELKLPAGFPLSQSPEGRSLVDLFMAGELDALVSPRAPSCFAAGHPIVRRLFEDFKSAEQAYFRDTGIFPIMHTLGIRNDVAARHPWLASSLFKAYSQAKRLADQDLSQVAALKIGLPWVAQEYAETRAAMGDDYWSYGVGPNRKALEALCRYAHDQGIAWRPLAVEELFAPSTLDTSKI